MTENRQLAEELLRGLIAAAGIALGIYLLPHQPLLAAVPFIAAIIAVRGCAFCYLFGLFGAARACAVRPNREQPGATPD